MDLTKFEVWFVTGSQHLYGEETLRQVNAHSEIIAGRLNEQVHIPVSIKFKNVVTTPDEIYRLCQDVNNAPGCIGIIAWMHTFSPAKMWIGGLKILHKPMLHFHTQFNRDIPWAEIDMDFMNLNQSAHGDREFGFMMTRMRLNRKVVTGHWENTEVIEQISSWTRVAAAWYDWQGAKFARFGDNMRQVAVTEGDKVEAELKFGYAVNGYPIGDLVKVINEVSDSETDALVKTYRAQYEILTSAQSPNEQLSSLREAARIEAGILHFLEAGNFRGFTDTFEDLHGLHQLPGIAVQRLMASGYGFAAEGDWKTAALVRAMKVMAAGLPGGNSFMEDYTYHFEPSNEMVLGSHMLEICESIAKGKPVCMIHPLSIGNKKDPVRLVFDVAPGNAINASMVDMGNRFRLLVNEVEAVTPSESLPQLPVARVLWKPMPDMKTGCTAWIYAGGAHHTCYSQNLTSTHMRDFADIAGIECIVIDRNTNLNTLRNELRWNEAYYHNYL